jgi:hypothetical protein
MIVIKFGKWVGASSKKHHYDRIYLKGYIWTPFCKRDERRYIVESVSKIGEKPRIEFVRDENEKWNR